MKKLRSKVSELRRDARMDKCVWFIAGLGSKLGVRMGSGQSRSSAIGAEGV